MKLFSNPFQKEVSPGRRLKGSVLERAIQDLEKGVAASKTWLPAQAVQQHVLQLYWVSVVPVGCTLR